MGNNLLKKIAKKRKDDFMESEEIKWEERSEKYEMESLYNIENNDELIRLEMNTIEYPLFSKNRKIKKNTIVKYEFNNKKHQFLKIEPVVHNKIPGELEEKIFFALMKIYKKNGHNETIYTDFTTLIQEMRINSSGRNKNLVRVGLKNLGGTTYEFNNLFYSNENKGILNTNLRTTMFSILIITLEEAKEITNLEILKHFRNSKIKEIIQIKFSQHFFENIIRKGYLYFDRQDLLQIENPVSRTLFMMLTKWRNKELYIKRHSRFLASRIPLSWKKTNISKTLQTIEQAFEDLKEKKVIKKFRFNSSDGRDHSYYEIWFDELHNKKYNSETIPLVLHGEIENYEITSEISEKLENEEEYMFIVESNITKQTRELLALLPEKAKTLTTMEGKVEKAIKKHGYHYTKEAVLYTKANAKSSFGKYFDGTIAKNWHEEFMNTKKEQQDKEELAKEKKAKLESKQLEIKLQESQDQKNKEAMKAKYLSLPEEEQSKIEKIVYTDYITKAGGNTTKMVKSSFERAKLALIAKYLEEINYFSGKKMVIESQLVVKSNEPQTMSQPEQIQIEPIVEFGEKRRDVDSLLGELSGNVTVEGTKDNLALNRDLVRTENLVVEKSEPVKVVIEENIVEKTLDNKRISELLKEKTKVMSIVYGFDEEQELK
ncbi:MAG: hypothetical protein ACRC6E_05555, partial [Fusobacteriaceae bacterium]